VDRAASPASCAQSCCAKRRLGIPAREQDHLADAVAADAMFITNARIGVVPVQRVASMRSA
jgi:branched-subunit amino acid aminotransferase/4-amino-4-deoxychorismate lyase